MKLIHFKVNGGIELGPKEAGGLLVFVFSMGMNYMQLLNMKDLLRAHLETSKIESQTVETHGYRLGTLETRIDSCCPWYHPGDPRIQALKPKDTIP